MHGEEKRKRTFEKGKLALRNTRFSAAWSRPTALSQALLRSLTSDDSGIGRVGDERLPLEGAAVSSAVGVAVLDVGDVALDLVHGGHLPHLDAARPLPVPQLRVHDLLDDETYFSCREIRSN